MQLVDALPETWKKISRETELSPRLFILNHHLIKKSNRFTFETLISNKLYPVKFAYSKPTIEIIEKV